MSTSATPNAKELFADAVELPPAQRDAFLREACRERESLLTEVRELLEVHDRVHRFLDPPTGEAPTALPPIAERAGSTIGCYRLLQAIGESGFGTVFMAEQREPVMRRVALRIINPELDTATAIARFETERQALESMDHLNIAKVLDAGTTDSGRMYFVTELVKGDPITSFCDRHMLTVPERLDLFSQVCVAVQHAHSKGVIHRNIKPTNILVSMQDGRPLAKVIDFGIANATARGITDQADCTEFCRVIATPGHMSPEQADGSLDIDTHTDVHALGVVLYELLTGSTPWDHKHLRSAVQGDLPRIIGQGDPPKPGTRIPTPVAALRGLPSHRRIEPARPGELLEGDLGWIVMKALEKDRARGYETANGLAMDIRRHLSGEAVAAAPSSVTYRVRKFARRHRVLVWATGVVVAVLGLIGATLGLLR